MTDPLIVTVVTTLLIVLSAFFVVIEFALLGARSHRLEPEAATNRSARAALRGINELTLMLAGAQLGITACTFALGAITKPAVDAWLGPVLTSWGVPEGIAGGAAFGLSLLFVTFLHLVVGEMAPKSWAIAHPERSAKLVGIPSRIYIWPLRPLLKWVNAVANRLVAASGVTPVERAAVGGQDADTIRHLVEHSASVGALDASFQAQLSGVLHLEKLTVRELVSPGLPTSVPSTATIADVQAAAARTEHLRILVDETTTAGPGVVHVRDTLLEPADRPVSDLSRPAFQLDAGTPVYEALTQLRGAREQLAVVMEDERLVGVITLSDVLAHVLPPSAHHA
ncbi:CNNM domain-containing protein [Arthrobacter sp. SX1312]|uniref:CNNM domain-containing protein n=1 Tax=Arthrobacter sp. SX1312 TaxID=2058896 RepID=UPI000CE2DB40|nr:hemolysin family protein [Arthrobacter sp. SX1312]